MSEQGQWNKKSKQKYRPTGRTLEEAPLLMIDDVPIVQSKSRKEVREDYVSDTILQPQVCATNIVQQDKGRTVSNALK